MPTSASRKRNANAPPPARSPYLRPLLLVVVLAALVVALAALPASMIRRFLPPSLRAEDFSGSLWHGSAGRLVVDSRDAGAIEWRLHPASLLTLTLSADVHWVKVGFVADGETAVDRHGVTARHIVGGGPLESLADLGVAPGWHGLSHFVISELKFTFDANGSGGYPVRVAVGDLTVDGLSSPQIAADTDLGGYALHFANGAITPDAQASAELTDTGGPLEVRATIHFSPLDHTGLLSGTVRERPQAPAALRNQLDGLTQMHPRDAQGRIPVELEFTL